MPHVPAVPPAYRFFARLDRFECECPSCGQIITTGRDQRVPARLSPNRARASARARPRDRSVLGLTWNPYAQRLQCPFCGVAYVAGLLLWPVQPGMRRLLHPPPDAKPTAKELLELRRLTGGWWAEEKHWDTHHVNLVVDAGCSCPQGGLNPACAIHHPAPPPAIEAKVSAQEATPAAELDRPPDISVKK